MLEDYFLSRHPRTSSNTQPPNCRNNNQGRNNRDNDDRERQYRDNQYQENDFSENYSRHNRIPNNYQPNRRNPNIQYRDKKLSFNRLPDHRFSNRQNYDNRNSGYQHRDNRYPIYRYRDNRNAKTEPEHGENASPSDRNSVENTQETTAPQQKINKKVCHRMLVAGMQESSTWRQNRKPPVASTIDNTSEKDVALNSEVESLKENSVNVNRTPIQSTARSNIKTTDYTDFYFNEKQGNRDQKKFQSKKETAITHRTPVQSSKPRENANPLPITEISMSRDDDDYLNMLSWNPESQENETEGTPGSLSSSSTSITYIVKETNDEEDKLISDIDEMLHRQLSLQTVKDTVKKAESKIDSQDEDQDFLNQQSWLCESKDEVVEEKSESIADLTTSSTPETDVNKKTSDVQELENKAPEQPSETTKIIDKKLVRNKKPLDEDDDFLNNQLWAHGTENAIEKHENVSASDAECPKSNNVTNKEASSEPSKTTKKISTNFVDEKPETNRTPNDEDEDFLNNQVWADGLGDESENQENNRATKLEGVEISSSTDEEITIEDEEFSTSVENECIAHQTSLEEQEQNERFHRLPARLRPFPPRESRRFENGKYYNKTSSIYYQRTEKMRILSKSGEVKVFRVNSRVVHSKHSGERVLRKGYGDEDIGPLPSACGIMRKMAPSTSRTNPNGTQFHKLLQNELSEKADADNEISKIVERLRVISDVNSFVFNSEENRKFSQFNENALEYCIYTSGDAFLFNHGNTKLRKDQFALVPSGSENVLEFKCRLEKDPLLRPIVIDGYSIHHAFDHKMYPETRTRKFKHVFQVRLFVDILSYFIIEGKRATIYLENAYEVEDLSKVVDDVWAFKNLLKFKLVQFLKVGDGVSYQESLERMALSKRASLVIEQTEERPLFSENYKITPIYVGYQHPSGSRVFEMNTMKIPDFYENVNATGDGAWENKFGTYFGDQTDQRFPSSELEGPNSETKMKDQLYLEDQINYLCVLLRCGNNGFASTRIWKIKMLFELVHRHKESKNEEFFTAEFREENKENIGKWLEEIGKTGKIPSDLLKSFMWS